MKYFRNVEVLKSSPGIIWYEAEVLDIEFANEFGAGKTVNILANRIRCISAVKPHFDPSVGDSVEARIVCPGMPMGWSRGQVTEIKDVFYYIRFDGAVVDSIFELGSLRSISDEPCLDISKLVKSVYPVSSDLLAWIKTPDAEICFNKVVAKTKAVSIKYSGGKTVFLIGSSESVEKAKLLLEVHFEHHSRLLSLHEKVTTASDEPESRQLVYYSFRHDDTPTPYLREYVDIWVDASLIGAMIGKQSINLRRIQEIYRVQINVLHTYNCYTKIRIDGPSQQVLEDTRMAFEMEKQIYIVPSWNLLARLTDKAYLLAQIALDTHLWRLFKDESGQCLVHLWGTRSAIANGRLVLEDQIENIKKHWQQQI